MLTEQEIDNVPECEICSESFNMQLPDMDEHRYCCEDCGNVVCYNCKGSDAAGNDFCSECCEDA